jgi:hypothetical protein
VELDALLLSAARLKKDFLVLFLKKELLPFVSQPYPWWAITHESDSSQSGIRPRQFVNGPALCRNARANVQKFLLLFSKRSAFALSLTTPQA